MGTGQSAGVGITLDIEATAGAPERLTAALAALPAQAVLIRPGGATDIARRLVQIAQAASAAAVIHGGAETAQALGADGVHVPWSEDVEDRYREARTALGPRMIVGVEAGTLRHDAMVAAEAGADYVAFDETASEGLVASIAWWSEIFEVPSLAVGVATVDEARALVEAGADFIGWRIAPGESAGDAGERAAALAAALSNAPTGSPGDGETERGGK